MSDENKLTGNWGKALRDLGNISKIIMEAAKLATAQNAYKVEATLVKHFQNQDLGWKKLNPAYAKYKAAKGLSNQVLISTATLMNSITTKISNNGMEAFVGVLRNSKRKDGEPPVLIAAVHEFGSGARGIPARPYLRPTFKEMLPEMQKNYDMQINKALKGIGR